MESRMKFEDILEKEGHIFYTNVGYSMYPLIKEREDILHIIQSNLIKKGDIVLFKDENQYILHRIIQIKKDSYILAGDHNPFKDKPIRKAYILGKLIEIRKKDGKTINLDKDKKVRRFFYTNFFPIKAFFQRILGFLHLRNIK